MLTARDDEEREILWELRRSVSPSLARKGITKVNEDVSLPLGRLGEAVSWIHDVASELELDCYIFGHCGDGNLHVNIMTDRRRAAEMEKAMIFVERLFSHVTGMGGTHVVLRTVEAGTARSGGVQLDRLTGSAELLGPGSVARDDTCHPAGERSCRKQLRQYR